MFGWSNREAKIPVTVDQPFWIGSICKSFVGIVAMQLRDEGKLDLHKPILETLPELPIVNRLSGLITAAPPAHSHLRPAELAAAVFQRSDRKEARAAIRAGGPLRLLQSRV